MLRNADGRRSAIFERMLRIRPLITPYSWSSVIPRSASLEMSIDGDWALGGFALNKELFDLKINRTKQNENDNP